VSHVCLINYCLKIPVQSIPSCKTRSWCLLYSVETESGVVAVGQCKLMFFH
jgi:hypothetical protein